MGEKEGERQDNGNGGGHVKDRVAKGLVKLRVARNEGKIVETHVLLNGHGLGFRFPRDVQPIDGPSRGGAPTLPVGGRRLVAMLGRIVRILQGKIHAQCQRDGPKKE